MSNSAVPKIEVGRPGKKCELGKAMSSSEKRKLEQFEIGDGKENEK